MLNNDDVYQIGQITKTHGLRGELVMSISDDIFLRTEADYVIVEIDGLLVPFFIADYRQRSNTSLLITFDDIDSLAAAQRMVGCRVFFEKQKVAVQEVEELSLNYFVGFHMLTADGQSIGHICDIDDRTANWLFVVGRTDGKELLVPAHEEFITSIDHEARNITVDLPEGLLEL